MKHTNKPKVVAKIHDLQQLKQVVNTISAKEQKELVQESK
jgi:hypothetical protein